MGFSREPNGPEVGPQTVPLKPAKKVEMTWQSVLGAFLVSSIVAGSYPYVVLKLGMGPNVSVVSAFLGAIFLNVTARKTRGNNKLLNNIIQTAGTSAAATAFMCVVAAAFGFLDRNETVDVHMQIGAWQMFFWLSCSGGIGVVFTVLFRDFFLSDPKMVFADGVAAAVTVEALDEVGGESHGKLRALGLASLASAAVDFFREGVPYLPTWWFSQTFRAGMEWNLLSVGSGLLVGLNMGLSMLLGTLVVWLWLGPWLISSGIGLEIVNNGIAPKYLDACHLILATTGTHADALKALSTEQAALLANHCGNMQAYIKGVHFPIVLLWAMWPATGLMVSAAMAAVVFKWRSLVDMFKKLQAGGNQSSREDMSLKAVITWALVLTAGLAFIQRVNFGMTYTQTVVAVLASLPLMLVGIRVLGETNQGPVSAMSNALQAVFAIFWHNQVGLNLIAAGMAGNTSSQSEGTIQDYKTGKLLGSTPRILTYVQLAAVPIGAAAVAIMYPLLISRYGLGGEHGLSAPTGIKLANMAVLLSKGAAAFPRYAMIATIVASIVGVVVAVIKEKSTAKWVNWIPSVAGFGFALILPGDLNIPMAVGGVAGWVWEKTAKNSYDKYALTVASGMIAGEAMLGGMVLPVLFTLGILTPG